MRIKILFFALLAQGCLSAGEPCRALKPSEEICQFYRVIGEDDHGLLLRPEQMFLCDPALEIEDMLTLDMANRGRLKMDHLQLFFALSTKRIMMPTAPKAKKWPDARVGAVGAAYSYEQSKFPTKHRAAMGIMERVVFGLAHNAATRWGVDAKIFLQPPPELRPICSPAHRDPEFWKIPAGEAWLRANDPVNASLSPFDRCSWDFKLFCKKHVLWGQTQTVIGMELLPPVKTNK